MTESERGWWLIVAIMLSVLGLLLIVTDPASARSTWNKPRCNTWPSVTTPNEGDFELYGADFRWQDGSVVWVIRDAADNSLSVERTIAIDRAGRFNIHVPLAIHGGVDGNYENLLYRPNGQFITSCWHTLSGW